jgi:hypothetical protein
MRSAVTSTRHRTPAASQAWLCRRRAGSVSRRHWLLKPVGRGPARQQIQGVLRGGVRLGGVGEKALAWVGRQREGLERQVEVSHDWVVKELDAGGVDPQVVECFVVRVLSSRGAQVGDGDVGGKVPIGVEPVRRTIEEREPGKVR